ncbi:hypothetical protein [Croceicoccus marinus]|uniref:Uncharacterized protein n=1 Tax=Croceicoccus marinus TaxID=450378 RepID=A0A1Z1FCY3_9SPHN|nr:hypothetical protein [Croceicoccus marinus]ARU16576.1 hypothetical protein A9D14_10765 [Croceicoccus marinus]
MHYIRTAEAMARVLDTQLEPKLHTILIEHQERLAAYYGFRFEELAEFLIVERGDTLAETEDSYSRRLVEHDAFIMPVELAIRHSRWIEVIFILSDDGFGLVLLVETGEGADPLLLSACQHALLEHENFDPGHDG